MINWQIFGLLTRFICCLAFWWALISLWPRHIQQVTWATFLFAVYPGFKQQFIAVTYSHDWIVMAIFFISLGTMIWAIRKPGWFWPLIIASWLLAAYAMFADEYYFGLELLRPLLLWFVLSESSTNLRQRAVQTIWLWLPYLLIMALFLLWRLVLHESPRGDVQVFAQLSIKPTGALLSLIGTVIGDVIRSSLLAWASVFNLPQQLGQGSGPAVLSIAATLIGTSLAFYYLLKFTPPIGINDISLTQKSWAKQAIILGGLALFVAGIPFWATYLPIGLSFPWDRFTLPMMFGTSLLVVGLLELLVRSHLIKVSILAILVGLAIGLHSQNATSFRREWASQKALFWQLSWRLPGIQPGTAVMSADLPFLYFSDNSLTAPLNWIYAPHYTTGELPYIFYNIESRQDKKLTKFTPGQTIEIPYRAVNFQGNTSQAIAIYYSPPGCVKVVNPATDSALPQKPRYFSEVLPLSDPGLVISDASPAARPPEKIFGPEPEPNWCYYFEKADLARQVGDWQKVVDLAKQAFGLNTRLYEVNAPELIPYIEGYAHQGMWDKAIETTMIAYGLTARMQRMLCNSWLRIDQQVPSIAGKQSASTQIQDQLGCKPP